MPDTPRQRLEALGLTLPPAPQALANYVPSIIAGNLLFISGQISRDNDGAILGGTLGSGLSLADGQAAARACALAILAQAQAALGTLEQIAQVVRITGYVSATPDFREHPQVVNGASDLLVAVLGDKGRHTRAAVGVASLPAGAAVEVDAIIKVTP